jgi:two-component system, cell cycle sensor histidine kinase and response regulator CckA
MSETATNDLVGLAASLKKEIGERKRAEKRLLRNESSFRKLFACNPVPMWVFDARNLKILEVNEAATSSYGFSRDEFLAMKFVELLAPPEQLHFKEMLSAGPGLLGIRRGWTHQLKGMEAATVHMSVHAVEFYNRRAMLALAENTGEWEALEIQLRQAQKMEAVGHLAGGIAHDFNNLLTVIRGYGEMLLGPMPATDPSYSSLREILTASEKASALTTQLLAFSRRQIVQLRVLNINFIVLQSERMLQRLIGEDIELLARLQPNLSPIRADGHQIEQIILNLVLNARDAMPQGGTLTIETNDVHLGEEYGREHIGTAPGRYVMLSISDTGHGMDAQTKARVFEPFFTTKGADAGTGLGLSMVYGIVKKHHGNICIYSEPKIGSTFKIYLPAVVESVECQEIAPEVLPSGRAGQTILLVEDDIAVRNLLYKMLSRLDYRVLQAQDHETALRVCREHTGPIHLLLTDVVMPGASGPEVAASVRNLRPEAKIVFMSGYTKEAIAHHGIFDSDVNFIEKPCSLQILATRLSEILDGKRQHLPSDRPIPIRPRRATAGEST